MCYSGVLEARLFLPTLIIEKFKGVIDIVTFLENVKTYKYCVL